MSTAALLEHWTAHAIFLGLVCSVCEHLCSELCTPVLLGQILGIKEQKTCILVHSHIDYILSV